MAYLQHIATENERWDSLAWHYYGDAFAYEGIIAANPDIPLDGELPLGQVVLIPIIAATDTTTEDLPPWLR